MKNDKQDKRQITRNDWLAIAARSGVAFAAMIFIFILAYTAVGAGIDGVALATSVSMLAGISAALLGIKLKDVLGK